MSRAPSQRGAMLAVTAAAALGAAGAASAQSCTPAGPAATQCRFVLSQPQSFTLEATASFARGRPRRPATLSLAVDGRSCLRRPVAVGWWSHTFTVRCRLESPAAAHVAQARLETEGPESDAVRIRLLPSPRLAALPREAADLYPRRAKRWPRLWPFGR